MAGVAPDGDRPDRHHPDRDHTAGDHTALRLLQTAAATSSLDRFAVSPLLIAIGLDLGASLGEVAAAASAYFLAYGLMQPVWGMLGDRIGLVRTMRIALTIAGIAGLASAFAPSLLVLAILRTVTGACFGAVNPGALVYLGDTWPARVRQRAMADLAAATSLGVALATAGAGALGDVAGWRVVLAVTAVAALVLGVVLRRLPPPPRRVPSPPLRALGTVLRERWALVVLVLVFVEGMAIIGTVTYVAPAVESLGSSTTVAGLAAAGYGVGVVLLTRVVRPLVGRLSRPAIAAIGGGLIAVSWVPPAVAVSLPTAVAAGLLAGAGLGVPALDPADRGDARRAARAGHHDRAVRGLGVPRQRGGHGAARPLGGLRRLGDPLPGRHGAGGRRRAGGSRRPAVPRAGPARRSLTSDDARPPRPPTRRRPSHVRGGSTPVGGHFLPWVTDRAMILVHPTGTARDGASARPGEREETQMSGMSGSQDPHSDYGYDLAHELAIALRTPMRRPRVAISVPAQVLRRELDLDADGPDSAPEV